MKYYIYINYNICQKHALDVTKLQYDVLSRAFSEITLVVNVISSINKTASLASISNQM